MIIHAKACWTSSISVNRWPYALRLTNYIKNSTPGNKDDISPIENISQIHIKTKIKAFQSFGWPLYALNDKLPVGKSLNKYDSMSRLGIYLGLSQRHDRSVALVLNFSTGLVLPQFQVQFDDLFKTVHPSAGNLPAPSQWQKLSGSKKGTDKTTWKLLSLHIQKYLSSFHRIVFLMRNSNRQSLHRETRR